MESCCHVCPSSDDYKEYLNSINAWLRSSILSNVLGQSRFSIITSPSFLYSLTSRSRAMVERALSWASPPARKSSRQPESRMAGTPVSRDSVSRSSPRKSRKTTSRFCLADQRLPSAFLPVRSASHRLALRAPSSERGEAVSDSLLFSSLVSIFYTSLVYILSQFGVQRTQGEGGTRYLWLKNPENLTDKQRTRLSTLERLNLKINRTYLLKELFKQGPT